jgi:hypothetical protein
MILTMMILIIWAVVIATDILKLTTRRKDI